MEAAGILFRNADLVIDFRAKDRSTLRDYSLACQPGSVLHRRLPIEHKSDGWCVGRHSVREKPLTIMRGRVVLHRSKFLIARHLRHREETLRFARNHDGAPRGKWDRDQMIVGRKIIQFPPITPPVGPLASNVTARRAT